VKLLNKSINTTNMPKAILTGPSVGEAVLLARAHVSEQLRASRRRQRAQPGQPPAPAPGTASASSDPAPAARHNARAEPDRGPRNSLIYRRLPGCICQTVWSYWRLGWKLLVAMY